MGSISYELAMKKIREKYQKNGATETESNTIASKDLATQEAQNIKEAEFSTDVNNTIQELYDSLNGYQKFIVKEGQMATEFGYGFLKTFEGIGDTLLGLASGGLNLVGAKGASDALNTAIKTDLSAYIEKANIPYAAYLNWINGMGDKSWELAKASSDMLNPQLKQDWHDKISQTLGGALGNYALASGATQIGSAVGGAIGEGVGASASGIEKATKIGAKAFQDASIFMSAMGSSTEETLKEGEDIGTSLGYGALSGSIEVISEELVDKALDLGRLGISKAIGATGVTKTSRWGIGASVGETNFVASLIKQFNEEGTEEVFSDIVDPLAKMITTERDMEGSFKEKYDAIFQANGGVQGLLESYILGGIGGVFMGGTQFGSKVAQYGYKNTVLMGYAEQLGEINEKIKKLVDDGEFKNSSKIEALKAQKDAVINKVEENFREYLDSIDLENEDYKRYKENQILKQTIESLENELNNTTDTETAKTLRESLDNVKSKLDETELTKKELNKYRAKELLSIEKNRDIASLREEISRELGRNVGDDTTRVDVHDESSVTDKSKDLITFKGKTFTKTEWVKEVIHEYMHLFSKGDANLIDTIYNGIEENRKKELYTWAENSYKKFFASDENVKATFDVETPEDIKKMREYATSEEYLKEEIAVEYIGGLFDSTKDFKNAIKDAKYKQLFRLKNKLELLFGKEKNHKKPKNYYDIMQMIRNAIKAREQENIKDSKEKRLRLEDNVDSEGNTLSKEQMEFFKDSKVVDEDGNLLVVYHGTRSGGFSVFKNDFGNYFFSDSYENAKTYSNQEEYPFAIGELSIDGYPNIDAIKNIKSYDDLVNYLKSDEYASYLRLLNSIDVSSKIEVLSTDDEYALNEYKKYLSERLDVIKKQGNNELLRKDVERKLKELPKATLIFEKTEEGKLYFENYFENEDYESMAFELETNAEEYLKALKENGDTEGVYECHLNMVNPLIVNCKGNRFDDILFNHEIQSTDDIAKYAEENGYDGVIFKNVIDNGPASEYGSAEKQTSYCVFNSNQIKLVNNNNPTKSKDIRYRIDSDYGVEVEPKSELELDKFLKNYDFDIEDNNYIYLNTKYMDALNTLKDLNELTKEDRNTKEFAKKLFNNAEIVLRNSYLALQKMNFRDSKLAYKQIKIIDENVDYVNNLMTYDLVKLDEGNEHGKFKKNADYIFELLGSTNELLEILKSSVKEFEKVRKAEEKASKETKSKEEKQNKETNTKDKVEEKKAKETSKETKKTEVKKTDTKDKETAKKDTKIDYRSKKWGKLSSEIKSSLIDRLNKKEVISINNLEEAMKSYPISNEIEYFKKSDGTYNLNEYRKYQLKMYSNTLYFDDNGNLTKINYASTKNIDTLSKQIRANIDKLTEKGKNRAEEILNKIENNSVESDTFESYRKEFASLLKEGIENGKKDKENERTSDAGNQGNDGDVTETTGEMGEGGENSVLPREERYRGVVTDPVFRRFGGESIPRRTDRFELGRIILENNAYKRNYLFGINEIAEEVLPPYYVKERAAFKVLGLNVRYCVGEISDSSAYGRFNYDYNTIIIRIDSFSVNTLLHELSHSLCNHKNKKLKSIYAKAAGELFVDYFMLSNHEKEFEKLIKNIEETYKDSEIVSGMKTEAEKYNYYKEELLCALIQNKIILKDKEFQLKWIKNYISEIKEYTGIDYNEFFMESDVNDVDVPVESLKLDEFIPFEPIIPIDTNYEKGLNYYNELVKRWTELVNENENNINNIKNSKTLESLKSNVEYLEKTLKILKRYKILISKEYRKKWLNEFGKKFYNDSLKFEDAILETYKKQKEVLNKFKDNPEADSYSLVFDKDNISQYSKLKNEKKFNDDMRNIISNERDRLISMIGVDVFSHNETYYKKALEIITNIKITYDEILENNTYDTRVRKKFIKDINKLRTDYSNEMNAPKTFNPDDEKVGKRTKQSEFTYSVEEENEILHNKENGIIAKLEPYKQRILHKQKKNYTDFLKNGIFDLRNNRTVSLDRKQRIYHDLIIYLNEIYTDILEYYDFNYSMTNDLKLRLNNLKYTKKVDDLANRIGSIDDVSYDTYFGILNSLKIELAPVLSEYTNLSHFDISGANKNVSIDLKEMNMQMDNELQSQKNALNEANLLNEKLQVEIDELKKSGRPEDIRLIEKLQEIAETLKEEKRNAEKQLKMTTKKFNELTTRYNKNNTELTIIKSELKTITDTLNGNNVREGIKHLSNAIRTLKNQLKESKQTISKNEKEYQRELKKSKAEFREEYKKNSNTVYALEEEISRLKKENNSIYKAPKIAVKFINRLLTSIVADFKGINRDNIDEEKLLARINKDSIDTFIDMLVNVDFREAYKNNLEGYFDDLGYEFIRLLENETIEVKDKNGIYYETDLSLLDNDDMIKLMGYETTLQQDITEAFKELYEFNEARMTNYGKIVANLSNKIADLKNAKLYHSDYVEIRQAQSVTKSFTKLIRDAKKQNHPRLAGVDDLYKNALLKFVDSVGTVGTESINNGVVRNAVIELWDTISSGNMDFNNIAFDSTKKAKFTEYVKVLKLYDTNRDLYNQTMLEMYNEKIGEFRKNKVEITTDYTDKKSIVANELKVSQMEAKIYKEFMRYMTKYSDKVMYNRFMKIGKLPPMRGYEFVNRVNSELSNFKKYVGEVNWNFMRSYMSPREIFRMLALDDNEYIMSLYDELEKGRDKTRELRMKMFGDNSEFVKFFNEHSELEKELRKGSKEYTLTLNGEEITSTKGEFLDFYKLLLDENAIDHMVDFGFEFNDLVIRKVAGIETYDEYKEAIQRYQALYSTDTRGWENVDIKKHNQELKQMRQDLEKLRNELYEKVKGQLNDIKQSISDYFELENVESENYQYVKFLDKMYELAKNIKENADNETKGYSNVIDGYYYPNVISDFNLEVNLEKNAFQMSNDFGGTNLGFAHKYSFNESRTSSFGTIKITDSYRKLLSHLNGMVNYAGIDCALQTFSNIYQYRVSQGERVADNIGKILGGDSYSEFNLYLGQLFKDMRGTNTPSNFTDKSFNELISKLRSGVVTATLVNPKVILSQSVSIIAASKYISAKSLAKAFFTFKGFKLTKKIPPLPVQGQYRYFDRSALNAETMGVRGFFKGAQNFFGKAIEFGDHFAINVVWVASLEDTRNSDGSYNIDAATELFNRVESDTQPNNDALGKPEIMRSKNEIIKFLTMYRSQAMQNFNILYGSFLRSYNLRKALKTAIKNGDIDMQKKLKGAIGGADKELAKSIFILLVQSVVYTMIGEILKHIVNRDWNEDEFAKNAMKDYGVELFNNAILNILPVFNKFKLDLDSKFFVSMDNLSMGWADTLIDSIKDITDSPNPKKVVTALSYATGIPMSTNYKYFIGIAQYIDQDLANKIDAVYYGRKVNDKSNINYALSSGKIDKAEAYYNSYNNNIVKLSDNVNKELFKLYKVDSNVILKNVPDTINYGGDEIEIDKTTFTNIYNKVAKRLNKLLNSSKYSSLSNDSKIRVITYLTNIYYSIAKKQFTGQELSFIESLLLNDYNLTNSQLLMLMDILDITSDEKRSKKENITKYIMSKNISKNEKYFLYMLSGYTLNEKERNNVKLYLISNGMSYKKAKEFVS